MGGGLGRRDLGVSGVEELPFGRVGGIDGVCVSVAGRVSLPGPDAL